LGASTSTLFPGEDGAMPRDYDQIREVASPLTPEMLAPLDQRCEVVQFKSRLTDSDFETLSAFLSDYPGVTLRVYGSYDGTIADLDFLRFFPRLRRFMANALFHSLVDISGLGFLPENLVYLNLGQTRKRLSLAPLARFRALRRLSLEGQTKDIEVLSELSSLLSLTLRSITLSGLQLLTSLDRLKALDLKLGSTKNLALLPNVGELRYLELWMIRAFDDLQPVAEVTTLETLFLQALRRVTTLPSFERMPHLRHVHLETMKGLSDLSPLRSARNLERLLLVDMPQLQPNDLRVLMGHPSLRAIRIGLGSKKKNEAARTLLGLDDAKYERHPSLFA
jgi:hypothetical protein